MQYKFLSEVGHHYANETTQPIDAGSLGANLRIVILQRLAASALQAKTRYEQLLFESSGLHSKNIQPGVKSKAAFFVQAAKASAPPPKPADIQRQRELDEARAKYESEKKHLENQGGVVKSDGTLDVTASDKLVIYDNDANARGLTKLRFNGGLIYTDDAFSTLFDTSEMSTVFSKLGYAIYVMSEQGNIHCDMHKIGYRHHSSLLAASNTAGAGELQVKAGRLLWLSNKSGHYQPSLPHFIQTLHQFQKVGIDLSTVRVTFFNASGGKTDYASVGDFLNMLKPEEDYHHAKLIAYLASRPYAQIQLILGNNSWRFPSVDEYHNQNKKGILDSTGNVLAHKTVIHYLKSQGVVLNPSVQSGATR